MPKEPKLQGRIVRDYLDRYPDATKRALSRLIYYENQEVFSNVGAVRCRINYYTGTHGDKHRKAIKDKSSFKKGESRGFSKLPEGLTTLDNWGIQKITGENRVLLLGDIHIPYHSKENLEIAVEHGRKFEPNIVLLNGDTFDHFSISHWQKDPRKRNFPKERETCLIFLNWLRDIYPDARIIFKVGNHEERYENYMEIKAPELLGIPKFEFESVFELDNYGIELVKDKQPIKLNELFIIHGHEYRFAMSNPVNPARGLYLRSKVNAICNHFHQPSSHSENDMQDKFTTCWSVGHLSDPHPKYMPLNKWCFGFCEIESSGQKSFQVHNYKIIDKEIYRS